MKEFLEFVVQHLVDKPEEVQIKEVAGEGFAVYELRVAKEDMGKVLGKRGQNAQAIRLLLNAASAAQKKKRAMLEILE